LEDWTKCKPIGAHSTELGRKPGGP
jgi:hypothetical protein